MQLEPDTKIYLQGYAARAYPTDRHSYSNELYPIDDLRVSLRHLSEQPVIHLIVGERGGGAVDLFGFYPNGVCVPDNLKARPRYMSDAIGQTELDALIEQDENSPCWGDWYIYDRMDYRLLNDQPMKLEGALKIAAPLSKRRAVDWIDRQAELRAEQLKKEYAERVQAIELGVTLTLTIPKEMLEELERYADIVLGKPETDPPLTKDQLMAWRMRQIYARSMEDRDND